MREKLEKAWMKVGKFLFWALVTALCGALTYMVFVHRRVIRAAIKGDLQKEIRPENRKSPRLCAHRQSGAFPDPDWKLGRFNLYNL